MLPLSPLLGDSDPTKVHSSSLLSPTHSAVRADITPASSTVLMSPDEGSSVTQLPSTLPSEDGTGRFSCLTESNSLRFLISVDAGSLSSVASPKTSVDEPPDGALSPGSLAVEVSAWLPLYNLIDITFLNASFRLSPSARCLVELELPWRADKVLVLRCSIFGLAHNVFCFIAYVEAPRSLSKLNTPSLGARMSHVRITVVRCVVIIRASLSLH